MALASAGPALVYVAASALLSILNRYLLHTRDPPFPFPSLLIAVQAVFLGFLTLVGVCTCWNAECRDSAYWPSRLGMKPAARLAVFGFSYAGDIFLTQSALSLAPVSMVEVIKTVSPVVVLVQTAALESRNPGSREFIFVMMICLGVVFSTQSGGIAYNVDPGGLFVSVLATLLGGTRLVVMQLLLQGEWKCPQPLLLMYFAPVLFVTGAVAFFASELSHLDSLPEALAPDNMGATLGLLALSSVLAFVLNYSELWCVRVTSALVLTLVSALKVVGLVVAAAFLAGHMLSPLAALGATMAIGGVACLKLCVKKPVLDEGIQPVDLCCCE